ncbi:hypothetical protein QE177_08440 [Arsenophonus sp. aPb]|uniref:hypothetical protein n=1 Tax=Arsenophonus sp. aPb TaxID=3041619 RepID=UPI002469B1EA|nr:hypothetical protein [Arsenophonus sp. aPb]WGL97260.1 hypothetical protein QE177_08440 [Arsenophonus sp. aPb]
MSLLLLKTRPQIVIPELAARIGLNESLVLQQVQYWLTETDSGIKHEGRRWIYNTFEKWLEQFPYFSEKTLKRAFTSLKKLVSCRLSNLISAIMTEQIITPLIMIMKCLTIILT